MARTLDTRPMVLGMEQELSFSPVENLLKQHLYSLLAHVPFCCNNENSLFLANGGRIYVDCHHSEYCTPECENPRAVVVAAAAGARIAADMAKKANASLLRHNVCYWNRRTWGCHESYLMRNLTLRDLRDQHCNALSSFFVSRLCLGGAGGVSFWRDLPQFCLSPRMYFFRHGTWGENTTNSRTILNARDEPHSTATRLHVICGDMLRSDYAAWLRLGTTALVIRMYDMDPPKIDGLLRDPVSAILPFCESIAAMCGSEGQASLQRKFLREVESRLDKEWMPAWAGEVVTEWDNSLSAIERMDLPWLAERFDWATKFSLMSRWLAGVDEGAAKHFDDTFLGRSTSGLAPISGESAAENMVVGRSATRDRLCELDLLFGKHGGIADQILEHLGYSISSEDEIEEATQHAPGGRAAARGNEIRRWFDENQNGGGRVLSASWDHMILRGPGLDRLVWMMEPLDGSAVDWTEETPPPDKDLVEPLTPGCRVVLREHRGRGRAQAWNMAYARLANSEAMYVRDYQVDGWGCVMSVVMLADGTNHLWRKQSLAKVNP